jgi:uncharacterized protein with HEPN domain
MLNTKVVFEKALDACEEILMVVDDVTLEEFSHNQIKKTSSDRSLFSW